VPGKRPRHGGILSPNRRRVGAIIHLKRVYEAPSTNDGVRVLVERLWPRGLTKERAAVDLWLKDIAPSPELRKWFGHDPARWEQFEKRYRQELREKKDAVRLLKQQAKEGTVTRSTPRGTRSTTARWS
jgi:uncharacterized protein YeaO (DUF488 family)